MSLVPPPTAASLYKSRGLAVPPFPPFQPTASSSSSTSSASSRGGSSKTQIRELRGGHRASPLTAGTIAEKSSGATGAGLSTARGQGAGGAPCSVRALGWSIDGRKLATSATDRTIRIWTPERSVDARATVELRGHTDSVEQLAWDPVNAERLVSVAGDETARFWDIRSEAPTATIATPGPNINVAYHPDGNLVAVGDREDTVSLLDVRMNKLVGLVRSAGSPPSLSLSEGAGELWIKSEREEVNEFSWTPDGSLFVLATGGGNVRLLDSTSMQGGLDSSSHTSPGAATKKKLQDYPPVRWPLVHTIVGHTASVFCLKFDPLGRYLATGSADSTLALWSTSEWFNVHMSGHLSYPPRSLSFSHDGEFLASGGEDSFLAVSPTCPQVLEAATSGALAAQTAGGGGAGVFKIPTKAAVNCLAWHPSRFYLAYAGDERDGTVRIWGMPSST